MINISDGVCDLAEAFQIYVLVVPEHLCAGVSDEGQLVLVGGLDVLHQRGESVSAAVGRVLTQLTLLTSIKLPFTFLAEAIK